MVSFRQAQEVAAEYMRWRTPGMVRFQEGMIPFRPMPQATGWGWVFAYGPRTLPGHVAFEVYVTLDGRVLGTNPPLGAH